MPIIRYSLGDVGRLLKKICSCGSQEQLFELMGRGYERIRVGSEFLTPEFICSHIDKIKGLSLHFQIRVGLENYMDKLTIIVESLQEDSDRSSLKNELQKSLGAVKYLVEEVEKKIIHPIEIIVLQPNKINRNPRTGKIKEIIDNRGQ
jgi:phenylacetate-coenzyme A ligase PaaK-like adenylate-forming protein